MYQASYSANWEKTQQHVELKDNNGEIFRQQDDFSHSRNFQLFDSHLRVLTEERGLDSLTIQEAGLESVSEEQASHFLGFSPKSSGLILPYFHPLTGEKILQRFRPDTPFPCQGKKAKYLSPKGAENHLYFPPHAKEWIEDPTIPLIITEGEFKTLGAYQAGLPCVGLIGVYGFRGKDRQGNKGTIPDLELIFWKKRVVEIVYDSDLATNEKVKEAQTALAKELYKKGVRKVYSVVLPPGDNGQKVGLDDYLLTHGEEAFCELEREELVSPYPKITVYPGTELKKAAIERPPAIVEGLGIREGGRVLLTGAGGRGKSTLLLQFACHLAAGTPLLGHPALAVAKPQRVVVFMVEDPLSEVKFRWEQQMRELGYGVEVENNIFFVEAQGQNVFLTQEQHKEALFAAIKQHQPTIVIFDPLITLHDKDENSNVAMRGVLDQVAPFQVETGCTFIIAHHEAKNAENNGGNGARGASAIRDWCRTMLKMSSTKGGQGEQRLKLELDKANYGGKVWNLLLERKQDSYLFTSLECVFW